MASETIKDAQELWEKNHEEAIDKDFQNLLYKLQKIGFEEPISNDNYLDALFLTDLMFANTNRELRILSGPSGDGFLEMLKENFEDALKKIKKNRGFARVILLSGKVSDLLKDLAKEYKETLKITLAKAPQKVNHFITCDSRMLRYEKEHDELKPNSPADAVKASVYFRNDKGTKKLEEEFDGIWFYLNRESD